MPYKNLKDYIKKLEKSGQLKRIKQQISSDLEITEIADRNVKASGPALLFENVIGSSFPVLINHFGSEQRMALALGVDKLEDIGSRIEELINTSPPSGLMNKVLMLPKLFELSSSFPKTVKSGACQEVVLTAEDADLNKLPVLKCWPDDGGRFITLPCVFSKDANTGKRNVGMYRMQIFDAQTTGMHWHIHKVGARHYFEYERQNKRMELAVSLGGDPAITYAATAPLPEDFDEMIFAGFLRKSPVEMVKCKTVDLEVPAESDIILEGYVEPNERRIEGPFGDHTGYYSPADSYPVFHLTCITHRKDAIYPATIVGKPPMEDCYIGKATERIFLPLLKMQMPEIVDLNLPVEGIFHNLAFVSIKKRYPMQAQKVINALWGAGQMMFTKIIVVFDEDVNVQNMSEVIWRLGSNIDPKRDIIFTEGPVDALDHAASNPLYGSKMGIDATKKLHSEGYNRDWPDDIVMSKAVKDKIDGIWGELGIG